MNSAIGKIIKQERQKRNLSQRKLANLADITNSYLCDIESGRTIPSLKTLIKIANALEINDLNIFLEANYVNNGIKPTA